MKIKNILVENQAIIMDEIERFLCVQGISYVKVENEIHCPNLILRFYDFEEYLILRKGSLGLLDLEAISRLYIEDDTVESRPIGREISTFLEGIFQRPSHLDNFLDQLVNVEPRPVNPKPYPDPKSNKKKQLRYENKKNLKKDKISL